MEEKNDATVQVAASGVLEGPFARIDAGDVALTDGEWEVADAELRDHLGYDEGDREARLFVNSRYPEFRS